LAGERALAAVVKGNAYGHGMLQVASAVAGAVDWFAVNSLDEAVALQESGLTHPILVMGATAPGRLREVAVRRLRQVVFEREGVLALASASQAAGEVAPVHLEIETGTNRLGIRAGDTSDLVTLIRRSPSLTLEGLYTHYANVEDTLDSSYAERQLQLFEEAVRRIEAGGAVPVKHSAASAAAILYPRTHFNLVRMGVSLYGLWPSETTRTSALLGERGIELRPALSWKTRLVHINNVPMGETIGYGCTFYASQPKRIAVIPAGYYEGLDRGLSSRGPDPVASVLVRGSRAPIVGRVSMNMTMVDVTRIPGAAAGDEAVIIGRQGADEVTAEELATVLNTINYEVVTRIGASLPRIVVDGRARLTESE
jgi:alanine racemase